ncbi:odorant receptor 56a-like, partial [Pogonomyrmex barbatus]|uniref:Odorant receptor 56a-like n=1 Tax=Pogonomyrmex barbatus TaxID=144034 RepID=A0A8N1S5R2_9HYME
FLVFISIGATCYLTAPFTIRIIDILLASNVTRPKRLPNPSEYFLDLEKYYYFLLAITYVGYYVCGVIIIATDTIYIALLQHACGILAILSHRLENLPMFNKSSNADYNFIPKWDTNIKDIIQCIQLQIRVERLIQLIESTFAVCLLTDIGFGILFQCSSCVMIVTYTNTEYLMKNCPLLAMQSIRLFFNSWIGQRIIDHSSQIPFAAYNGIWYQMSLEARKMLLFLIMKCRKPYHITMAKLYIISLEGYSMLMRASASYITLMISLNTNDA